MTSHEAAFRFLHLALLDAEKGDASRKRNCAALTRQYRMWRDNMNSEQPDFVRLKLLAMDQLGKIARAAESDVFVTQGLGSRLGHLGAHLAKEPRTRHDDFVAIPLDVDWEGDDTAEWSLINMFALLATAVQPLFKKAVQRVADPHGAHHNPGIKNIMRMKNKLYADYVQDAANGLAIRPFTPLNVDINRCACTFDDIDQLTATFNDFLNSYKKVLKETNTKGGSFADNTTNMTMLEADVVEEGL